MKKYFIKDLQVDDKLKTEAFVLRQLLKKTTKNNDEYWDIVLADKTGEINAKVWHNSLSACEEGLLSGSIVEIDGVVKAGFRGQGHQIFINKMKTAVDVDQNDFMQSSEIDPDELWQKLEIYVNKIENKYLLKLFKNLFDNKEFFENYKLTPAAERAHHDFLGGLMQHTLEMLVSAESIFLFYPEIDKDLVIAGILLHDIGKVQELSVNTSIERTNSGHFLSHIYQGTYLVNKEIDKIKDFPENLKEQILHIILSHHGTLEFGSPVVPKTIEARLVNLVDVLSSKLQIAHKILEQNNDNDEEWSNFNRLLNTRFYVANNNDSLEKKVKKENNEIESTDDKDLSSFSKNEVDDDENNNLELPF